MLPPGTHEFLKKMSVNSIQPFGTAIYNIYIYIIYERRA